MAVDNLNAADLVVDTAGWQPIETIPKDGTVVEVIDESGFACKAQWNSERVLASSLRLGVPKSWRPLE